MILTAPELEQVTTFVPAVAVGGKVIVIVLVDMASKHPAFPAAVNVRILLPADMSAALGVYVHKVKELASVKFPVPFDVQVMPEVFVALDPAVILTAPVVEQVVTDVPAFAIGSGVIVRVLSDVTSAAQGEFG